MAVERVEGVIDAKFSYEGGSGVVTFDAEETDPDVFIRELEDRTGFLASVVESEHESPERDEAHDGH